MKSFKNYMTEQFLIEAKYEDMFVDIKDNQDLYKWAMNQITWAKKTLKKQDRITWFLRIVKLWSRYNHVVTGGKIKNFSPRLENDVQELVKMAGPHDKERALNYYDYIIQNADDGRANMISDLKTDLTHFIEQGIPDIDRVVFKYQSPITLFAELKEIEKTYTEKFKDVIPQDEREEAYHKPIIKFSDGYQWVNLNKAYCDKEGKAMGHCGNVTGKVRTDQRILSLRELVTIGKKKYWRPHLTFILEEDGRLGEMKGKGNSHPIEKYHKYIIALLEKTDLIKGIHINAGYLPENDFKLIDLPKNEVQRLIKLNPKLATLADIIKVEGQDSPVARQRAFDILREFGKSKYPFSTAHPYFILEQYDDIDDLIKHSMLDNKHLTALLKDGMDDKIQDVIMEFIPHPKQLMNDLSYYIPRDLEEKLMDTLGVEDSDELYKKLSEDDELMDRIRSDYEEDLSEDLFNTNVKNIYSYIESCTNDASIEQTAKRNQYGHGLRAPLRVIYKDPKTNKYEPIIENSPSEILFEKEVFLAIDTKATQFTDFMAEVEASPNYEPDTSNPTSQLLEDIIQWDNPGFAMIEEPLVSRAFQEKRKKSTIWQLQEYIREHSK